MGSTRIFFTHSNEKRFGVSSTMLRGFHRLFLWNEWIYGIKKVSIRMTLNAFDSTFSLCRSRSILKIGSCRMVSLEPWSCGRFLSPWGRRRWTFFILFCWDLLLSSFSRRTSFFPKEKAMGKISVTTGSFLSQQTLWMRQSRTMETNSSHRYVRVERASASSTVLVSEKSQSCSYERTFLKRIWNFKFFSGGRWLFLNPRLIGHPGGTDARFSKISRSYTVDRASKSCTKI